MSQPTVNPARVPRHVAVIMDGNGRWAKARNLPRLEGHRRGTQAVEEVIRAAREIGVEYLTLYAFSVENWSRPALEVRGLMTLLMETLRRYARELADNQIALRAIGRLADLPGRVREQIKITEKKTAAGAKMTLLLALSYGGRVELVEGVRELARRARAGELEPADIDEATVSGALYTAGLPDPDLLIRTSGEMRLSNFLPWQMIYTELYVTPTLWPDFGREAFLAAINEYHKRERRFGGV
ncbi:MAG: isoprenyl transferase [Verrucomicrobiales bacterium]|nr:isoprenyl transferase [Verrucomicrobiales bacterium]